MKFIDLFAGLGGFHIALTELGHQCVFASEKKENLAQLYTKNFGIDVNRDITTQDISKIPKFDILCAGFPCQPFSKAGSQKGLMDEKNGSLFDKIVEILEHHQPEYFILENVRNLESHDNFSTWNYIKTQLEDVLGYQIDKKVMSPHNFGIPQHRERLFIIGSKNKLSDFRWPNEVRTKKTTHDFLDSTTKNIKELETEKSQVLEIWQEFLDRLPKNVKLPGFPIWSMEFGATYPYENEIPYKLSSIALGKTKGNFGVPLLGMTREQKFDNIPNYSNKDNLNKEGESVPFPEWKIRYIKLNREFYLKHKKFIDPVLPKIKNLGISSWQKFEWNVQGGKRDLSEYIIQFRGSGIRIKKPDFFPSLVTVSTQIPIIGWQGRYLTPNEGARIQSLGNIELPENIGTCFSALGNAVNAHLVKIIAQNLISKSESEALSADNEIKENKVKKIAI